MPWRRNHPRARQKNVVAVGASFSPRTASIATWTYPRSPARGGADRRYCDAHAPNPAEFLNVYMQQIAGMRPFMARTPRGDRASGAAPNRAAIAVAPPTAVATRYPRPSTAVGAAARSMPRGRRGRRSAAAWATETVPETIASLCPVPTQPFPDGRLADLERRRDLTGAFAAHGAGHDIFSTVRRGGGILVHVHPQCVDG